jgi:hypothetical protein
MTQRRELAALIRVIDTFGADIAVSTQPPLPRTTKERVQMRLAVEEEASMFGGELLPLWSPPRLDRPGRVAVVTSGRDGEPGFSKPDRMVQHTLRHAGIPVDRVAWVPAVWRWDNPTAPPSPEMVDLWQPFVLRALDAADVDFILLHGSVALQAFRFDIKISQAVGRQFIWQRRWFVTPVASANSVLRKDGQPEAEWRRAIVAFADRVNDNHGLNGLSDTCLLCGNFMYAWDDDGVPYCRDHFEKNWRRHEAAKARIIRNRKVLQQGALL